LGYQESGESRRVAVRDDSEGFAGVAVDEHCHIPLATPQAGLVDQQHPAAAPAPLGCDQL
jgi:hypothetical protein